MLPATDDGALFLTKSRFQALVTLFPKYFSSFVRTTCALSVSGLYLALAEIYLPISAALPSSTTLSIQERYPFRS